MLTSYHNKLAIPNKMAFPTADKARGILVSRFGQGSLGGGTFSRMQLPIGSPLTQRATALGKAAAAIFYSCPGLGIHSRRGGMC